MKMSSPLAYGVGLLVLDTGVVVIGFLSND